MPSGGAAGFSGGVDLSGAQVDGLALNGDGVGQAAAGGCDELLSLVGVG